MRQSRTIEAALIGLAAGMATTTRLWLRPRKAAQDADLAALRTRLAAAEDKVAQLAALRSQISGLRHDLRGILSPALLVSDHLLAHEEPRVRRAGEVMVRTVERATARLASSGLDQAPPTKSQT